MTDISYNEMNTADKKSFVPIEISAPMVDMSKLSGRFSESFVEMLSAAITPEIERLTSTEGLAESGVRIYLVFAPETYMEHTSESVTYRRLLLSYGQGAPRDLWVRWTRLDGEGEAYSLSDTPDADCVKIEIGEDVPQKIREKEYRFLARTSPEKYRAAMGKRNVTEWRELIKRAIKNGDLAKVERKVEISKETEELSDKLAAVLGVEKTATAAPEVNAGEDDIAALARAALGLDKDEPAVVSFDEPEPEAEAEEPITDESIFEDDEISEEEDEPISDESIFDEVDEPAEEEIVAEEIADEPIFWEKSEDVPEITVPDDPTEEETPVIPEPVAEPASAVSREELEERIRAELEAKIRLEYESRARRQAEEEAERLRLENERLRESARLENERREAERVASEERIRAELEVKLRDESRERERLAEAARAALYEREQLEAERAREAEARAEAERAERERAERERERERVEAERAAEAERLAREIEERASATPAPQKYTYTKRTVLLLFRRSVDPNVTARIHEIIKATIDYYGKGDVYIRVKASLPDSTTVRLDFVEIPTEELPLLTNIIKVLGNSGLGIAKAKIQ